MKLTRLICLAVLCVVTAACAGLAGLPDADGQLRIFEGDVAVAGGGQIVSPVEGQATGHGCIVSQVGRVDAVVRYSGDKCKVTAPCDGCAGAGSAPASTLLAQ